MKPFLAGRPIQSAATVRPAAEPGTQALAQALASAGHRTSDHGGSPTVECVKQGDKVVQLIITCSCGERIEIDCLYPPGS